MGLAFLALMLAAQAADPPAQPVPQKPKLVCRESEVETALMLLRETSMLPTFDAVRDLPAVLLDQDASHRDQPRRFGFAVLTPLQEGVQL